MKRIVSVNKSSILQNKSIILINKNDYKLLWQLEASRQW